MSHYIKILLIVIFFSGCSFVSTKRNYPTSIEKTCSEKNILYDYRNYIGMSREQIVHIFGMPVILDSFDDVYHYYINEKENNFSKKRMLNLYFKDNSVSSFDVTIF